MGCGANCREIWKPELIRSNRPPRGGWRIEELPLDLQPQFQFAWEARKKGQVDSGHNAVEEAISFLKVNGIKVTSEIRSSIQEAANDQYCKNDPSRCTKKAKHSPQAVDQRQVTQAARTQMMWAGGFWITTNILAAGNFPNPAEVFDRMARYALDLLATPAGCEYCHGHWRLILEHCPPTECIKSMEHARVWLWRAHNATRDNKAPIPFQKVAHAWKWPAITDIRLEALLTEMNMVFMP
jgi:hypothetical protein